jgi:hypothetical protein
VSSLSLLLGRTYSVSSVTSDRITLPLSYVGMHRPNHPRSGWSVSCCLSLSVLYDQTIGTVRSVGRYLPALGETITPCGVSATGLIIRPSPIFQFIATCESIPVEIWMLQ